MELLQIYQTLLKEYSPQNWWPTTPSFRKRRGKVSQENYFTNNLRPKYTGGPKNDRQRLEVAIGAILAQNTSWKNAEKAIENLNRKDLIDVERLKKFPEKELQEAIRPSGFFVQKTNTIKTFVNFIQNKKFKDLGRKELLSLKGIGPETVDSILLYACGKPEFVVDAYTRRIFGRIFFSLEKGKAGRKKPKTNWNKYEEVKEFFEKNLPNEVKLFQEYHALLVEHAKRFCRKNPECGSCPLAKFCLFGKSQNH